MKYQLIIFCILCIISVFIFDIGAFLNSPLLVCIGGLILLICAINFRYIEKYIV